jgi:predicted component of type VI protein secretion system
MALNVKLVVVGGDVKTTELTLRLPSTIGRGRGTSIVLPHPLVSRQHCELFEADGQLMVRDLGSLNGTFVNNQRVTESPLAPGELLTVGTVTFRAVYEGVEEAAIASNATVKVAPGDKTIRASKAPTIKATPKEAAAAAHSDSEVLEFNFDQPLMPGEDEEPAEAGSSHPTERLSEPMEQPRAKAPASDKDKKAEISKKASAAAADDVTIRSDADGEDDVPSESDDDLKDFLKSLGDGS